MKKLFQKLVVFLKGKSILRSKRSSRKGIALGFTLIELLVASLIASLLVVVMLGFLVGVLDSDRKETAKSNAQEELQAAISYISDDLQEAIYIYGANSLAAINNQLPHRQGIATGDTGAISNVCNSNNFCTPVLVFWKRYNYSPLANANYTKTPSTPPTPVPNPAPNPMPAPPAADEKAIKLGCMAYRDTTNCDANNATFGRDTYTYSLVVYYLKNDSIDNTINTSTWSKTARILRWELKDGYPWYCSTGGSTSDILNCPTTSAAQRTSVSSPLILTPTVAKDEKYYFITPDQGFNRPDFASQGILSTLASGWKKFDYFDFGTNPFTPLVDFMDDTAYDATQGGNNNAGTASGATAAIRIPIGKNVIVSGVSYNLDCDDPSIGVGNVNAALGTVTQRIPADFNNTNPVGTNPALLSSFYVCVAPESVTARIYMRGNALARLGTGIDASTRKPTTNNIPFFPTADVRSFGRGLVNIRN